MKKLILWLTALVLILSGCNRADEVRQIDYKVLNQWKQAPLIIKEELLDFYYVTGKGNSLYDEKGDRIRFLYDKERLGVRELSGINTEVHTRSGEVGFVDASILTKNPQQSVALPIEGVNYGVSHLKDEPIPHYRKARAVYFSVFNHGYVQEFVEQLDGTDINAVVIDYKSDSEKMLFKSEASKKHGVDAEVIYGGDAEDFFKPFRDRDLYLIARIVVFKSSLYAQANPQMAVEHLGGGLLSIDGGYWGSPFNRKMWDYIVDLTREAYEYGFDEVQFDYVRFPGVGQSNADMKNDNDENPTEAIQKFILYARQKCSDLPIPLSADVFGWSSTALDDMEIGQQWEAVTTAIDVISPMFYPSHYSRGNYNIDDPNAEPYELVLAATRDAIERNSNVPTPAIIRPWIQGFDSGNMDYGYKEIQDQIKALEELGIDEYMIWNPNGRYPLKPAGKSEDE